MSLSSTARCLAHSVLELHRAKTPNSASQLGAHLQEAVVDHFQKKITLSLSSQPVRSRCRLCSRRSGIHNQARVITCTGVIMVDLEHTLTRMSTDCCVKCEKPRSFNVVSFRKITSLKNNLLENMRFSHSGTDKQNTSKKSRFSFDGYNYEI